MYYIYSYSNSNYEHIVKTNQNMPASGESDLPEEIKFRVVGIHITLRDYKLSLSSQLSIWLKCSSIYSSLSSIYSSLSSIYSSLSSIYVVDVVYTVRCLLCFSFNNSWTIYFSPLIAPSLLTILLNFLLA